MSLAKISGLFRLTRDAELRYGQNGSAILKMGLACSEKFGDRETQLFIDATAFGKPAEILNSYAGSKGTQIYLFGKLQTESWVDQQSGDKRSKTSMIVEGFDFVSKGDHRSGENNRSDYTHQEPRQMPENNLPEIDINEDEIPF